MGKRGAGRLTRGSRPRPWATALTALATLALDQASKAWIVAHLHPGQSLAVLGPLLSFTLVTNRGMAFGLLSQASALVPWASAAAALAVWRLARRGQASTAQDVALGMVLGGALGNWVDRWRRGSVVDFVNVHVWPVFNVADAAVTVGTLWWLWAWWPRASRDGAAREAPSDDPPPARP
jgi:signal peptidase II